MAIMTKPRYPVGSAESFLDQKTVLVTGGCGSIGSALVSRLLDYPTCSVRALDTNETGLFDLEQEYGLKKFRPLVGDVRDRDRLRMAMAGVDVVFHAAALKHVPLCQYNPFEAVKTNLLGTQNVIEACLEAEVDRMMFISTDKAVLPSSVMGMTKSLGEALTIAARNYRGRKETKFACVRFGNVLGSRGSVVPLFKKQIQKGRITITDPAMTRFAMTIPRAVDLVIKASTIMEGGEIFILKMPAVRIGDLVEPMIDIYAPGAQIAVETIGKRAGEKMHEDLIAPHEENLYETTDMLLVLPGDKNTAPGHAEQGFKKAGKRAYSSMNAQALDEVAISELLREIDSDEQYEKKSFST